VSTLNSGRVAIVTGAGAGIGRSHALALAASGARIVVNDVAPAGDDGRTPAERVVAQITEAGGEAIASSDDVSADAGAQALVESALTSFGDLHVLVNNAGILRDRMLPGLAKKARPNAGMTGEATAD
jgi:NAD(P)-dependent dehydrogenase (short-subunit alcohol dehydrogenase family)